MTTRQLVERLFFQKEYFKILRVGEYLKRQNELKLLEENNNTDIENKPAETKPKGDKDKKSGSLFLVENPSP